MINYLASLNYSNSVSGGSGLSLVATVYIIIFILILFVVAGEWKIFKKAGRRGWAAIIPIYNLWVLFEIVGYPGWWSVLSVIPIANIFVIVVELIAYFRLGKLFGKSDLYSVLVILLPFIYIPMLGFGKSQITKKIPPKSNLSTTKKIILIVILIPFLLFLGGVAYGVLSDLRDPIFVISGPSMAPTLENGQRIITTTKVSDIKRYDIVVIKADGLGTTTNNRLIIKRVIGLPGDHVVIKNGSVTIYNSSHPTGFNPDQGQKYLYQGTKTAGNINLTVPKNTVFVLGDNRSDSLDSRFLGLYLKLIYFLRKLA